MFLSHVHFLISLFVSDWFILLQSQLVRLPA
jgi:hypothetical protein